MSSVKCRVSSDERALRPVVRLATGHLALATLALCLCAFVASPALADDFQARFKETYASPLTVKREAVRGLA